MCALPFYPWILKSWMVRFPSVNWLPDPLMVCMLADQSDGFAHHPEWRMGVFHTLWVGPCSLKCGIKLFGLLESSPNGSGEIAPALRMALREGLRTISMFSSDPSWESGCRFQGLLQILMRACQ